MAVANADQVSLFLAPEVVFGTPDATATLEPWRFTSESLKEEKETAKSAEITPDRQDSDVAEVQRSAGGTVGYELSHLSHETQIEAVFQGEFTPSGGSVTLTGDGAADLDFTAADSSVNCVGDDFVALGFIEGQRVTVDGSASNDGVYRVGTVATLKIILKTESGLSLATITDEADVAATLRVGATITATTISYDAASQEVRDSGNGFIDAGFQVGDWVLTTGSSESEDNDLFRVSTLAAGAMKLVGGEAAIVDDAAGDSITVRTSKMVVNAAKTRSFTIEERHNDLADTDKFVQYPGSELSTMSGSVTPSGIVGGEFGVLGKIEQDGNGSSYGAGDSAAATTRVINATGNVTAVLENEVAIKVTGFTFEITNNSEALSEVSEASAIEIAHGKFQVSGTFTIFLRDNALLQKYRNFTETNLSIRFKDPAGNRLVLDLPRVFLTDGGANATAQNTRVSAEFAFETAKDQTEGRTARWVVEPA